MRSSLRPGLLKAVAYNESHRNLGVGADETLRTEGTDPVVTLHEPTEEEPTVGVGVGVVVTVGVAGNRTAATGVPPPEPGVLASRAVSVAASAPTSGFRGAKRVPSLESRP